MTASQVNSTASVDPSLFRMRGAYQLALAGVDVTADDDRCDALLDLSNSLWRRMADAPIRSHADALVKLDLIEEEIREPRGPEASLRLVEQLREFLRDEMNPRQINP